MDSVDILIIGGGIAGLATARDLAQRGMGSIALVDREVVPGFYASGHNAGIARTLTGRLDHSRLALEGRKALAGLGLLDPTGGLLLAMDARRLEPLQEEAAILGVANHRVEGSPTVGFNATAHLRIPDDGVIDIHGLLGTCARDARAAGVALHFGAEVHRIQSDDQGFTLETSEGAFHSKTLVNAAGAWASTVGRMAGGMPLEFAPLRRHLAWSDHPCPATPWAWWVDRPFYLRAESGGTLLCPCDEDRVPLPAPGHQPATAARPIEALSEWATELAPQLLEASPLRAWCGLRTFSPDRKFVIGWDALNPRLFWVAGLGGHGMTTGLAVGRFAAALIRSRSDQTLSPSRFL